MSVADERPQQQQPDNDSGGDGRLLRQRAAAVVARLAGTELMTRQVVDGMPGGPHRSPRRGGGVEFAEHKEYSPGDDLRHLDWRAYARADRLAVKRYEQEVHVALTLVIDGSASMAVGGEGNDKLECARLVAGALALLTVRQGDAVGLLIAGAGGQQLPHAAGAAHAFELIERLSVLKADGPAGFEGVGRQLRVGMPRRGVVVAIGDGLADPATLLAPLVGWQRAGLQVVFLHLLHPLEVDLSFDQPVELVDAETGTTEVVDPRFVRNAYVDMMRAHCEAIRRRTGQAGLAYAFATSGEDPAQIVRRVLGLLGSRRRG